MEEKKIIRVSVKQTDTGIEIRPVFAKKSTKVKGFGKIHRYGIVPWLYLSWQTNGWTFPDFTIAILGIHLFALIGHRRRMIFIEFFKKKTLYIQKDKL